MTRRAFRPGRVYRKKVKLCTKPPPAYKPLNSTRNSGIQGLKHKTSSKSQKLVFQRLFYIYAIGILVSLLIFLAGGQKTDSFGYFFLYKMGVRSY